MLKMQMIRVPRLELVALQFYHFSMADAVSSSASPLISALLWFDSNIVVRAQADIIIIQAVR
jgi:hypothetical protein